MTHDLTRPEEDPSDEPARYAEEVRRSQWWAWGTLAVIVVWALIALLVDMSLIHGLIPLLALGGLPLLRMLIRPRPLRKDPTTGALRRVRDGTALKEVEGMPVEEARLALLDHLDIVEGRVNHPGSPWWLHRFASVAPAVGTFGWATAGVVAAVLGASAADLSACVFGTALFGAGWWFIEKERKKERETARILRARLDALGG